MAGALTVTIIGLEEATAMLNGVKYSVRNLQDAWDAVIEAFFKLESNLFESEGATGASGKWTPLDPLYYKRKLNQGLAGKILQRTGTLKGSLTARGTNNSFAKSPQRLDISIDVMYGRYAQYGFTKRDGGSVPPRPPIDLTEDQKGALAEVVAMSIMKNIRKAQG